MASGMGTVQISYGLVEGWVTASTLRDQSGVPRGSESAGRPPLLVLVRRRLASKLIDMEAT